MRFCIVIALLVGAAAAVAQPTPAAKTPDRSTYLRAAIQTARAEFVETVARVSGVSSEKAWKWMPANSKLTHADWKIIYSIERERGARLTDEQRREIMEADARKNAAIDRARLESLRLKP